MVRKLAHDTKGATAVEYALIIGLVGIAAMGAIGAAGYRVDRALMYARAAMLPNNCAPGSHRVVDMENGPRCAPN